MSEIRVAAREKRGAIRKSRCFEREEAMGLA